MGTESGKARESKRRDTVKGGDGTDVVASPDGNVAAKIPTTIPEQIDALLRGFMVSARMLILYPPGHGRVTRKLSEIQLLFAKIFEARNEPLEMTVAGHRLLVGESTFDEFSEVSERFAVLLRHRQIRAIVIQPGIDEDEIRLLVELMRIDHRALLRIGGTRSFVDQRSHPHIQYHLYEADTSRPSGHASEEPTELAGAGDAEEGEPAAAPPAEQPPKVVVDASGNIRLPEEPGGEPGMDLELEPGTEQERFEQQLEEFALKDLVSQEDGDTGPEYVAFSLNEDLLANEELSACLHGDVREIKRRFRRHSAEETSLRILFRLLSEAEDEAQYRQRRRMLLQAVRDPRFFTGELLHVIRRLVEDGSGWGFERGEELAQSVIAYVNDAAAVSQLLISIPLVPEVAQGVLSCLATREDALPLLARLLTCELPRAVENDLPQTLVEVAEGDSPAFVQWALHDRKTVLRPTVLRILLDRCPSILAPVCERLLLERTDRDRRKLLHLLCSNGSENSLRVLARAVRACGHGVSVDALESLSRFPHPLALEVLREVVQRNNNDEYDREEAESAIYSLYHIGIKEARTFLWEIVQSRRSLFSYAYVRPLRLLAESVLQGPEQL